MYALVIGRAFPDEKTGMMGIFEFEQARALNKHGLKSVYAFCDTRSIKSLRKLNFVKMQSSNVPVYGYHFPIGGIPRPIFDKLKSKRYETLFKKIIAEQGVPDIIHVHFPLLNLNNEIWEQLKALNVPIVVTEHWSKVQLKKIEPYRVSFLRKIVKESHSFNCVGEKLKRSVIELTGTSTNNNIQIIPNMVKPIFYYEKQKEKKNKFDFIAIGRLVETKRFELLVDAFYKAFSDNPDIYLHIVGDGPLYKKLHKQIRNTGMDNRIKMHGFLSREGTADLIRKSDAFVSASVIETFGVPFIEAMACGKPVIGVQNGPIDNYIKKDKGILFKGDNIESLVKAFITMYNDWQLFDKELIAKETISKFSEQVVISRLKIIYKSTIRKNKFFSSLN